MATIASPGTKQENLDQQAPIYNVVLLDDAEHTYDYVVEMLEKLFALSTSDAWNHAVEVDTTGRTIVITCELPAAEFGRDQIHALRGRSADAKQQGIHVRDRGALPPGLSSRSS